MADLVVGSTWAADVARIRDEHSDDTNLVRFGNDCYRSCRDSAATFDVHLRAADDPSVALHLQMQERDFYIHQVTGFGMTRYAATFSDQKVGLDSLNHAIHDLAKGRRHGDDAFLARSLVVFCLAESMRNDHFATTLDQTLRASRTQIKGVPAVLPVGPWLNVAHQWGQASDSIRSGLPADVGRLVGQPLSQWKDSTQRTVAHRIDLARVPLHLQQTAASLKVLKRPG